MTIICMKCGETINEKNATDNMIIFKVQNNKHVKGDSYMLCEGCCCWLEGYLQANIFEYDQFGGEEEEEEDEPKYISANKCKECGKDVDDEDYSCCTECSRIEAFILQTKR